MALAMHSEELSIHVDEVDMEGMMWLPEDCIGVVIFAHGSGSSRVKPPNDYVASVLRAARLGTLWLDLLTPQEAGSPKSRADIEVLTRRLSAACDWLRRHHAACSLPLGLYGVSNGAAAALQLAAARGGICAVVARGGLPDLVGNGTLAKISAPTLLIAGSLDDGMVKRNRSAYAALRCKKRFEIIPGATHAFDEPGSLEVVARLARAWFLRHSNSAYV